jgi:hypothetical protein
MTRRHRTSGISLAPLFAFLAACAALSGQVVAQEESQISVAIRLAESPEQANQVNRASQGATFSVRPSVTSSNVGRGEQTLVLDLRCLNNATGQIIPFCNLNLTWQARANSGGHNHGGSRPKGTFDPPSGNTGSSGVLTTTYTAPEASGIIDVHLAGTLSDGRPVNPTDYTIGVELPNLVSLGTGTNYILVGATSTHGDNHYGTPTFNGALRALADAYTSAFPGQRLAYNDMSLPQGGLFDIRAGWAPPHSSHRFGVDLDLRLVPAQQRPRLRQLINAAGIRTILVEGDHWHIRQ